jgi:hypothetical protein
MNKTCPDCKCRVLYILFFGGGRGRGGRATAKATVSTRQRSRFCRIMKQTAAGKRIYPVPRCRRRNGTAKVRSVKGLRVEIFLPQCVMSTAVAIAKKYYPSLDRPDRRSGRRGTKLKYIPFSHKILYDNHGSASPYINLNYLILKFNPTKKGGEGDFENIDQ